MAIKASASITLSFMVDVKAVYRYYKLQASTASEPSIPTTNPPSGWTDTEPRYTSGNTNTLYFVDLTVFSNDTWTYSSVSKSSSYEASKEAYNKALNVETALNEAIGTTDISTIGDGTATGAISALKDDLADFKYYKIAYTNVSKSLESMVSELFNKATSNHFGHSFCAYLISGPAYSVFGYVDGTGYGSGIIMQYGSSVMHLWYVSLYNNNLYISDRNTITLEALLN